jgi:hypothetical protein
MSVKQQLAERGVEVERREYDGNVEFVADLGPGQHASVDVVGETVIVVADGEQYDIEVGGNAQAFIKNGVLTIDVTDEVDA